MYFHYFVIISPWKRAGPFIWTNLNPLHPRMLCIKFGWNWPSGSGEEHFYKLSILFLLFPNYLPFWKGVALHLNKLQSWIPFTKGYFVPSLIETVLEKKMKMCKVNRRTDGRTDDRRQVVRKVHFSFQLRWAKNYENIFWYTYIFKMNKHLNIVHLSKLGLNLLFFYSW